MNFLEMAWSVVIIFIGIAAADLIIVKRSTKRAIDAALERPMIRKFNELLKDPNFEKFVLDTLDSIQVLNRMAKKIEKEGLLKCLTK